MRPRCLCPLPPLYVRQPARRSTAAQAGMRNRVTNGGARRTKTWKTRVGAEQVRVTGQGGRRSSQFPPRLSNSRAQPWSPGVAGQAARFGCAVHEIIEGDRGLQGSSGVCVLCAAALLRPPGRRLLLGRRPLSGRRCTWDAHVGSEGRRQLPALNGRPQRQQISAP